MHSSVPHPLRRAHARLINRDAAGLIVDRLRSAPLMAVANWLSIPECRGHLGFPARTPILSQVLRQVQEATQWQTPEELCTMVHCIFGTGLVAGCHLRDVSEHETPTCCTVSFTTALDRLEDSDLRTLLWSIGLPNQTGSVVRIVDQIVELLPDLPTRLMLAMQMSECVETPSPTGTTQMLFLAGLIAAGIQPPTVEVSAGR